MKKTKQVTFVFWLLVTIIPILGIIISLSDPEIFIASQNIWREYVLAFGILAPLAFVLIQALQVIVTPISHYSIGVLGGFLFGPFLGGFYNWVGRMIGHIVAFFLARKLGRPVVDRFVDAQVLEKYDRLVSDRPLLLFLIYFLPVFPDDEISYLVGLSEMRFKTFLFANIFGHVGGSLGLAYIGAGIGSKDTPFWILTMLTFVGFFIFWFLVRRAGKSEKTLTEPRLVTPSIELKDSYISAIEEFQKEGRYTELVLEDLKSDFEDYIQKLKDNAVHPEGTKVPESTFWLTEGGRYIGRVSVRHRLNDKLLEEGGHIGYDIRPSERQKGYGKKILALVLPEAKKFGIEKALLTCDSANIASRKIIESQGGVFENEVEPQEKGKPSKLRFWIDLTR